jgi:hypothetical protein
VITGCQAFPEGESGDFVGKSVQKTAVLGEFAGK